LGWQSWGVYSSLFPVGKGCDTLADLGYWSGAFLKVLFINQLLGNDNTLGLKLPDRKGFDFEKVAMPLGAA
jgi:hypothetical protein